MPRDIDESAPLTDYERSLLKKLFRETGDIPAEFWTALRGKLEADPPSLHISDMPTLKGEEWREVGATGQPAFASTHANYGSGFETAAFYKDALGIVHLKGLINPTATGTLFTLPVGYRPFADLIFPSHSGEPHAIARIDVLDGGEVQLTSGNLDYVTINGITFRAA